MSCCAEKDAETVISRTIDKKLTVEFSEQSSEVKLLLLGTGESGKSTFVKQMRLLYQGGFTKDEALAFKEIILNGVILAMQTILSASQNLNVTIVGLEAQSVVNFNVTAQDREALRKWILVLWTDPGVQECYTRSNEYQLTDSASYYFENIERLTSADYVPTDQDILRSRVRTSQVVEVKFQYSDLNFRMFDVGGQRNERKKWLHCFQDVTAVLFVVAISEYDLKLLEDSRQNRMIESLWLFNNIYESKWFDRTNMILFLNKTDLFKHKLCTLGAPLTACFPNYTGGANYDLGSKYVRDQFMLGKLRPDQVISSSPLAPHLLIGHPRVADRLPPLHLCHRHRKCPLRFPGG